MKRRKPETDAGFGLELTPMIDVTFLLLVFFLVTLKFKTLDGKLSAYLPKDVGANRTDQEPVHSLEIRIRVVDEGRRVETGARSTQGSGRFEFEGRRLAYRVGPRQVTGVAELEGLLRRIHTTDPERSATLVAEPGTVLADVVAVLDRALLCGWRDVTFAGASTPAR